MWLISYRYCATYKYFGRHNTKRNAPVETVEVIDQSPEEFLLAAIRKGQEISEKEEGGSPPERFDKIDCIFYAREIDATIGKELQDSL